MEQSEVVLRAIAAVRAICEEPSAETNPQPQLCGRAIWSVETEDTVHRFHGQAHARLFPFIGRKVRTPAGPGTLLQVLADHVTVLMDFEASKCSTFRPGEVEPVTWALQSEERW